MFRFIFDIQRSNRGSFHRKEHFFLKKSYLHRRFPCFSVDIPSLDYWLMTEENASSHDTLKLLVPRPIRISQCLSMARDNQFSNLSFLLTQHWVRFAEGRVSHSKLQHSKRAAIPTSHTIDSIETHSLTPCLQLITHPGALRCQSICKTTCPYGDSTTRNHI